MTDQDTRTPTTQETALYDALTEGDHDQIADMREAAYSADQNPPESRDAEGEELEGWLPPAQQVHADHTAAQERYQADNEAPEEERVENTAAAVEAQNAAATELEEEPGLEGPA